MLIFGITPNKMVKKEIPQQYWKERNQIKPNETHFVPQSDEVLTDESVKSFSEKKERSLPRYTSIDR